MGILPKTLEYFSNFTGRSLAELDTEKEKGKKIAGVYCLFAPVELIRASGMIPVGLCGKKQDPIAAAEQILPSNLCPLIKSSYGFAITEKCPFFAISDIIIGETTCDGKKKMFELMGQIKPVHTMHLPYAPTSESAVSFWLQEIIKLKEILEKTSGNKIKQEDVKHQIKLQNEIRRLFQKIMSFFHDKTISISGMAMLPLMESKSFFVNPENYIEQLKTLIKEMEDLKNSGALNSSSKRILLTGTPVGKGSEKVVKLIEECGGNVVCMENCTGIKTTYSLIDENEEDPLMAIAKWYLSIPCSCMSPNKGRMDLLEEFIKDFHIDGVVDLTWQFCHTYNIEAHTVKKLVEEKFKIPSIHIESDYSESDIGQLKVRIQAFMEIISNK
ncbi:MAG: 2-hydroxyacyl-CoA dehydratase [Desulfobacterales bacterium]|nr:2-hydroxyacyl-CoA dehydratase [Desulfobacterales bacterium]